MENLSPTARVLHEEHRASQILLNRVEQAVRAHQPDRPPAVDDGPVNQLLGDLIAALEGEVRRHFRAGRPIALDLSQPLFEAWQLGLVTGGRCVGGHGCGERG